MTNEKVETLLCELLGCYINNEHPDNITEHTEAVSLAIESIKAINEHSAFCICPGECTYKTGIPFRHKGTWNVIQSSIVVCPFCGAGQHPNFKNFCPKCGADLREE